MPPVLSLKQKWMAVGFANCKPLACKLHPSKSPNPRRPLVLRITANLSHRHKPCLTTTEIKIHFMNMTSAVLKIVVIQNDLAADTQAARLLRRLTAQLEGEFKLEIGAWQIEHGIWRFEMLRDPELWKQAAVEAAAADMIVFSAGDTELPANVRAWIETVLSMREGAPAALVALVDGGNDGAGGSSCPDRYLRRLAGRYGLDFFCNADNQHLALNSRLSHPIALRALC
jgi:hypothetical protein